MGKIITIGREFGSGGRELGRRLAEALGFEYYDKEIISEIAKKTSLSEQYVQQIVENNPHELYPITIANTFSYVDMYAIQNKQAVIIEQENVLKEMAEKSNCVIVGRSADYILRKYNPYKIFVYADMESKLNRCKKRNKDSEMSDKKMIKSIKLIDKNRARNHKFISGENWGEKNNYDICINTSNTDIKKIAIQLAEYIKAL